MTTTKIRIKHDEIFKKSMENPVVAKEFLETYLPEEIKSIVDIKSLKLEKESYVEETLRSSMSDVLFSVKFNGRRGYLYTLLEHQSKPDEMMGFRLFKYMLNICDRHMILNPEERKMPLVYPIVLYNGKEKYNVAQDLWSVFQEKELAKRFWNENHQVINLHEISDEKIMEKAWLGMLQFFLKYIFEKNLINRWKQVSGLLPEIIQNEAGYDYIKTILYYTLPNIEKEDKIELQKLLSTTLNPEQEEKIMTSLAQSWFSQGEAEGEVKGEVKATKKIAISMLRQKVDLDRISGFTGLSKEALLKLQIENP